VIEPKGHAHLDLNSPHIRSPQPKVFRPQPISNNAMRWLIIFVASLLAGNSLAGETVSGLIVVKRRLTKRSVTPTVPIYQRGPSVELGKSPAEDLLSFERSRVAVWIEGPGPSERASASMQQAGRRFSPDLLVVPVGAVVSFPNMDPIFHNVFSLSRPQMFDLGSYCNRDSRDVTFSKPGIVNVYCHLHPNMSSVIVVTPNRWNAKADGGGRFELRDVPPADYTVVAWHRTAGYFRKDLRVAPGVDSRIEFLIPLEAVEESSPER
jgi:plastocyanin